MGYGVYWLDYSIGDGSDDAIDIVVVVMVVVAKML